ncbi:hypothetical protein F4775DRAFT_544150 [Biscogniauxia sp. FL1348]|nr:hypothetical protein F4775DRAFT_544150 [Biscogniauxia sp. FL1348]
MDIFGTSVAAGTLVIQFLGACSEFSSDAKSLKARFEWDLRALEQARESLTEGRISDAKYELPPEDQALIRRTSEYLDRLDTRVRKKVRKIERKGWLEHTINMATWIARRSQIQEMEREIREWTERLNLRVLSLPRHARPSTQTGYDKSKVFQHSAVVRSGERLQEFITLSSTAKILRAKAMALRNPEDLVTKIRSAGDVSSNPLWYDGQQVIFSSKEVSAKITWGTPAFETLDSEMGELAAALSCLDPSMDIRLLKVSCYFYHPDFRQFIFIQVLPHNVDCIMTLEEFIKYDPFPGTETSLNERFKVAYKLAEAVFFLHIAGFCHKNITSRSVAILRQFKPQHGVMTTTHTIDEAYLMGFDLIRGVDAISYGENGMARSRTRPSKVMWDFDIFQHPDRLQGDSSARYKKVHDIYSLGVVLLELGFWQPLSTVARQIDKGNPHCWARELSLIAPKMRPRVGERYLQMVQWCLSLKGDRIIKNVEFIQEILDPLEEMMSTLA